jgi:hypothetical protein
MERIARLMVDEHPEKGNKKKERTGTETEPSPGWIRTCGYYSSRSEAALAIRASSAANLLLEHSGPGRVAGDPASVLAVSKADVAVLAPGDAPAVADLCASKQ